jgi:thymidylate kinase
MRRLGEVLPVRAGALTAEPADNRGSDVADIIGAAEALPDSTRAPIRDLIARLARMNVRYCHWKSNVRLVESLAGAGDLDLLVDRRDAGRFQVALLESGFKPALSVAGAGHPGVFHAFALDPERAELIHVHAYFQIVTGDSLVKTYRLPFEETLLAGVRHLYGVPVPAAEAELVLFTLRIALKHTSFAEVLMVGRDYHAVPHELEWLRAASDPGAAELVWKAWLPDAPLELFRALMEATADSRAVARRVRLGRTVARHLLGWRRLGRPAVVASRTRRVATLALGRLGRHIRPQRRRGLTPATAGTIVAFVGPKASGKSTLSAGMAQRLGKHYSVCGVHVGKPPATVLSLLPRLFLPLARRLFPRDRSSAYESRERREDRNYSILHLLQLIFLAYDRRALLRRCWRDAAAGSIVLADRYPSASVGATDSSRFDEAALARCSSRLKRWMMQRERALYAGLPQPHLVLRLTAPLETSIRRDAERDKDEGPDAVAVERRRRLETRTDYPGARVVTIDTDRPLEETMNVAMHAAWSAI